MARVGPIGLVPSLLHVSRSSSRHGIESPSHNNSLARAASTPCRFLPSMTRVPHAKSAPSSHKQMSTMIQSSSSKDQTLVKDMQKVLNAARKAEGRVQRIQEEKKNLFRPLQAKDKPGRKSGVLPIRSSQDMAVHLTNSRLTRSLPSSSRRTVWILGGLGERGSPQASLGGQPPPGSQYAAGTPYGGRKDARLQPFRPSLSFPSLDLNPAPSPLVLKVLQLGQPNCRKRAYAGITHLGERRGQADRS